MSSHPYLRSARQRLLGRGFVSRHILLCSLLDSSWRISCLLALPACLLLPLRLSFLIPVALRPKVVHLAVCQGIIHLTIQQILHHTSCLAKGSSAMFCRTMDLRRVTLGTPSNQALPLGRRHILWNVNLVHQAFRGETSLSMVGCHPHFLCLL